MKTKVLLCLLYLSISTLSVFSQTRLVWSNTTKHTLSSCDLQGTDVREILTTNSPVDLVFSEQSLEVYFTDISKKAIYAINVETNKRRLVIDSLSEPRGIIIDAENAELYWCDKQEGAIFKSSLTGENKEPVLEGLAAPDDLVIDFSASILYWSDASENVIYRAAIDGSDQAILAENTPDAVQLELSSDQQILFWLQDGQVNTNSGVRRINVDGTEFQAINTELSRTFTLDTSEAKIYWVDFSGDLHQVSFDGTNDETLFEVDARQIAFRASTGEFYWTRRGQVILQRSNADGSTIQNIAYNDVYKPTGLVVDTITDHIYYINSSDGFSNIPGGAIMRTTLNGKRAEVIISDHSILFEPLYIDVDNIASKMYWTDGKRDGGSVWRANLDGTEIERLSRNTFSPRGISIDTDREVVYWVDDSQKELKLINADGIGGESAVFVGPDSRLIDAFYHNNRVFWSDNLQETMYFRTGALPTRFFSSLSSRDGLVSPGPVILSSKESTNPLTFYWIDITNNDIYESIGTNTFETRLILDLDTEGNSSSIYGNLIGLSLYDEGAIEADNDEDGFYASEDCDDENAKINAVALEVPNNDIDEDCDGIALVIDADMDGFNSDEDCHDGNAEINPGATEIPDNGIDEDCNGEDLITSSVYEVEAAKISIYPNPVRDKLMIGFDGTSQLQGKIHDMNGRTIREFAISGGMNTIDVNDLASGLYYLMVSSTTTTEYIIDKIVKQ